jgi:hypothetical protein
MISKMMGGFIVILVGISLIPTVAQQVKMGGGGMGLVVKDKRVEHKQTYEEYVRERLIVEKLMK